MASSNQERQADSTDKYYLEEAGSACDAKLVMKLKIPKSKEGIEEGETSSSMRKKHYCADCDKNFSTGKALGGHVSSAHVQPGKVYQSKKLRLKNSTNFKHRESASCADIRGGAKTIFCLICRKDFPSQKSLYGHMKCHPDRVYRGMQPPFDAKKTNLPSFASDASEDDVDKSSMEVKEKSPSFASDYDYDDEGNDQIDAAVMDSPVVDLTKFLTSWAVTGQRGRPAQSPGNGSPRDSPLSSAEVAQNPAIGSPRDSPLSSAEVAQNPGIGSPQDSPLSSAEEEKLNEVINSIVNLVNEAPLDSRHKEEDKSEEHEDMSCNSMTPGAEIVVVKPVKIGEAKKQSKEVYPAKKAQDFPVKPIKIGETKPNADADCYKDVKRASKSRRQRIEGTPATGKRQFSPVKKLIIDKRKPKEQILQRASYEGKGKAPLEPKFREFHGAIYESEDEDLGIGSEDNNKSLADDSDCKRTPEQQNQEYVKYRKKNGLIPYKKLEKPLSTKPETNLSPVAERKDAITEFKPEKYKCSTCDKSFPSPQALGGHRSSHNKFKMSIHNTIDDSSPENQSNSISQLLEAKEGSIPRLKLAENAHQCMICNKTFSSGPALGGHMRCHTTGPSSKVASPEKDIQPVRKALKLDLNELPDMKDRDDQDGGN